MTKKYLKKNNLRDWLRVVASSKVPIIAVNIIAITFCSQMITTDRDIRNSMLTD